MKSLIEFVCGTLFAITCIVVPTVALIGLLEWTDGRTLVSNTTCVYPSSHSSTPVCGTETLR